MGEERLTLVDFNEAQRVIKGYGGNAGRKAAVLWEGSLWMVKFPESTAGMRGNILSDTTSPVAEYIGSHVFEQIGVPVHRTVLGTLEGKVVVACRDLEWESSKRLVTFHDIKNAEDSGRLLPDGTASSGAALFLSDIGAFPEVERTDWGPRRGHSSLLGHVRGRCAHRQRRAQQREVGISAGPTLWCLRARACPTQIGRASCRERV